MTPGSLSFAAKEWLWPAAGLFLAGLFFIWRSYAGTTLPTALRALCFALKAIGLALLLSILFEPTWTTTRPREGANFFAVIADNSIGLQLRDTGESKTRGEGLRDLLTSNHSSWLTHLEETYLVRRYLFDARLEGLRDFAQLNFEGRATALGGALRSAAERFQGQPLAGILLFTDGNATDLESGFTAVPGLPPVYPVVVGSDSPLSDVAVNNIGVTQTAFEDAPVTLTATVDASNFENEKVFARVILNGQTVAQQTVEAHKKVDHIPFRFQLKPDQPGISFYELKVGLEEKEGRTNAPAEATLYNNSRVIPVDRGKGKHRILYVSGRPNWEFKFMNRALAADPQVELLGLIRIARREPKFTFRGRTGESSNPLFRGFNQVSEETERYDQPVIIRVNTKDENELRGGFPKTAEDLYGYEAVILDDLEAEFFNPDQMMLVQHYVSERGGGFLMLGGADSLQDGKYLRTPIGEMLPAYLDRIGPGTTGGVFRLELTREGWLQPWIRLRTTEEEERERLSALPAFQVLNRLREVKPGASVLAIARDNLGTQYPAIAVQRFGSGRVATVALGDLWRGGLGDEKRQADLGKTWRQMLRWLSADVPKPFELTVSSPGADSDITLNVKARDKSFKPLENANVQISIRPPGSAGNTNGPTNLVTLTADASDSEPGQYRATYIPRESGGYLATAMINDVNGVKAGEAEAGWASEPLAIEFASLQPNKALLEDIARKSGGEVVAANRLDQFVQALKKKKAPVVETYSYPIWHTSAFFVLALVCFVSEWGIRRVKGLA